jgi:hypothetical protein
VQIHWWEIILVMQFLLDGMPNGEQKVNAALSLMNKKGGITFILGGDNYFAHPQQDKQGRRFALGFGVEPWGRKV